MTSTLLPTRERLVACALRLFAENGYTATSVADVAREAGVSHMTFFRHFPTKESVVAEDVFDPVIAEAIAIQPAQLPPLARAVRGLVAALDQEEARREFAAPQFRQRIELAATTPALRQAVWASGQVTQAAIAKALTSTGSDSVAAHAAAGAVIGAATSALLGWAEGADDVPADAFLRTALLTLLAGAR